MLKDKYQSLLDLGVELNVQNGDWKEEGGKLRITGTAAYQYDKDRLWDKIKSYENWENEVEADIAVANGPFARGGAHGHHRRGADRGRRAVDARENPPRRREGGLNIARFSVFRRTRTRRTEIAPKKSRAWERWISDSVHRAIRGASRKISNACSEVVNATSHELARGVR